MSVARSLGASRNSGSNEVSNSLFQVPLEGIECLGEQAGAEVDHSAASVM